MENNIQDGTFQFKVTGGIHDGRECTVDLFMVSMMVRELEKSPEYKPRDMTTEEKQERGIDQDRSFYVATPEFCCELSRRIEKAFGFCTPSIAQGIWGKLDEYHATLKKNTDSTPS